MITDFYSTIKLPFSNRKCWQKASTQCVVYIVSWPFVNIFYWKMAAWYWSSILVMRGECILAGYVKENVSFISKWVSQLGSASAAQRFIHLLQGFPAKSFVYRFLRSQIIMLKIKWPQSFFLTGEQGLPCITYNARIYEGVQKQVMKNFVIVAQILYGAKYLHLPLR